MRLGAIVLFFDGLCYQSFNWKYFRPLGSLQTAINSLESYGVDEICIIRPVRGEVDIESYRKDLQHIRQLDCLTPISFGGGIRNESDITELFDLPVERYIISSSFIQSNEKLLQCMNRHFGRQAILALLPVSLSIDSNLIVYDCQQNQAMPVSRKCRDMLCDYANEIVLYDKLNEGSGSFNFDLVEYCGFPVERLLISGGVGAKEYEAFKKINGSAMLVENRVLHHEFSKSRFMHG
ncbi:MAG TPA: hypothetical protein DG048_24505 [Pseudoalteromonas sp.]|nr:hypothetical protein [Pseudoalteromonas sp.]